MLPKLRDALLCLLLLVLLLLTVATSIWLRFESKKVDSLLDHLNSAAYNLSDASWQADAMLFESRPVIRKTLLHVDQAAGETSRTMQHVAHVSQNWADQQEKLSASTMIILEKTVATVDTLNEQIGRNGEQLRYTLSQAETVGKTANSVLSDLDRQVNDPNIADAFKDVHFATSEFGGTMAEVHGTSKDFHDYIHRLTAPMGFWKSLGKHVLSFGEHVGANAVTP